MMHRLALAILPMIVTGCVTLQAETTVLDRAEPLARAHATALAGDDLAAARTTGRALLATLAAGAGWRVGGH